MLLLSVVLAAAPVSIDGSGIRLEFDARMHSRVVAVMPQAMALGPFGDSERLRTSHGEVGDFSLESSSEDVVHDALGDGRRLIVKGTAHGLSKQVEVVAYRSRPGWLFMRVRYTNDGSRPVRIDGYVSHRYSFETDAHAAEPQFWSYQSASYEKRPDWILPVAPGYSRGNYLGMNASDYGGGTPVLDVWRRDVGIAIGHVELAPRLVSLPVHRAGRGPVTLELDGEKSLELASHASFETVRSFVSVHHGDHFATLRAFGELMRAQGLVIGPSPKDAFEPIWCAWGYGRTFTPAQVFETLPVAERLGFKWVTLDDGWQVAEGDWTPVAAKFPNGDADMRALVDRIHAAGFKAQLWWSPLASRPGARTHREHPDWLLRNANQSARKITWWNAEYLCPAYEPVQQDAIAFVRKALGEWGFDGLKIDGQHLNAAPPCFNPAHHHAAPEESFERVPEFFKGIWEAAQQTRPGALVEICPCGTGYSFYTLPYLNMVVGADPESSWQVRLKGKSLKALAGDALAYFGDHVELSDGGTDFASTVGVGGVIGSNFAWREASGKKDPKLLLTPAREAQWAQWTAIYQDKRLSEGEYLGTLYDIGFDRPEAHVIRRAGTLYYAFYAPHFDGVLELRGLEPRAYRVVDYVAGRALEDASGPVGRIRARFDRALLLEVAPR